MEIIVGRKGDQPFQITEKTVSGRHLKLTVLDDGTVQIDDLGSSNGTYVDGVRVIKKTVDRNTVVRMGPTYTFRVKDALTPARQPQDKIEQPVKTPKPAEQPDRDTIDRFNKLESVWETYRNDKIKLQRDNAAMNFLRIMPMLVLGAVGYAISCFPALAGYRLPITFTGLGLGVIITWISYKTSTSLPEKMERLNQQFQIDYVCPECKQFLGFTPFEGLKNKGKCSACKTKWVK